ncbi:hypothetical protein BGX27_002283 [Mortierella sp. AM989]|nr:hypothetical protein BGX27_002283 [Mortierella sp. AM989]
MVKAAALLLTFCASIALADTRFFYKVNYWNTAGTKVDNLMADYGTRVCICLKNIQTGSIQGNAGGDIKLFQSTDCTGNFQKLGSNSKLTNTQWVNSISFGKSGIPSVGPNGCPRN